MAHHAVQWTVMHQRCRNGSRRCTGSYCANSGPFSVDRVICVSMSYQADPQPDHRPHPLTPSAANCIRLAGALVTSAGPPRPHRQQRQVQIGRGHSARPRSCPRVCVAAISASIFGVARRHSREVSSSRPEPMITGPVHRLGEHPSAVIQSRWSRGRGRRAPQEGIWREIFTGLHSRPSSCIMRTPSSPSTLAISCAVGNI